MPTAAAHGLLQHAGDAAESIGMKSQGRCSTQCDVEGWYRGCHGPFAAALLVLATFWHPFAEAANAPSPNLADLSIEELGQIPVTSVTGRPQPAQASAASIFVITADDIRRSAATSLPEALRLAPNLEVARVNAGQYAISARGFNNAIGNKLLVMIDGRTVYSPLFSGVFWDAQDVVLEDIERIEVISGAGATLWGANAVNGVINVITRAADATQGLLAAAHDGNGSERASVRYGGRLSEGGAWRVFATQSDRGSTELSNGKPLDDHSTRREGGFRMDWSGAADRVTVQGDLYRGGGDGLTPSSPTMSGGNLLARWRREQTDGSNWQLQAYYDQAKRDDAVEFRDNTRTVDIQFNQVPVFDPDHSLIWGAGYRRAISDTQSTPLVLFDPPVKILQWSNLFVQDEVHLSDRLHVTGGAKVETNVYTGAEFLPTLRATYGLGENTLLWASASRAVRAPARLDRDFYLPSKAPFIIEGGPNFQSEVAKVYELGLRGQPLAGFSYSLTAFHDDYQKLRAGEAAPTTIDNLAYGGISGLEASGSLDLMANWRLSGGWVAMREALHASPSAGASSVANLGDDPNWQWTVRSTARLAPKLEFDLAVRHVSGLPDPAVPAYTVADLRLGWQVASNLEASVLGQNLGRRHVEFDPASSSKFGPAGFVRLEWRLP
jgi:iron complex outermembrane receptor protein